MFYTKKLIPSIKQSLFLNILLTCVFNRIGLDFLSPQIIQTIQMLRKTVPHHHHLPSASELFRNAGTLKLQTHWNSLIKWYKYLQALMSTCTAELQLPMGRYIYLSFWLPSNITIASLLNNIKYLCEGWKSLWSSNDWSLSNPFDMQHHPTKLEVSWMTFWLQ